MSMDGWYEEARPPRDLRDELVCTWEARPGGQPHTLIPARAGTWPSTASSTVTSWCTHGTSHVPSDTTTGSPRRGAHRRGDGARIRRRDAVARRVRVRGRGASGCGREERLLAYLGRRSRRDRSVRRFANYSSSATTP